MRLFCSARDWAPRAALPLLCSLHNFVPENLCTFFARKFPKPIDKSRPLWYNINVIKEREDNKMNHYNFIIQFLESYEDRKECAIYITDNNTVISTFTLVEKEFSCTAPSYETARILALEFAQKTVREYYEPLGVWVAFRLCIVE